LVACDPGAKCSTDALDHGAVGRAKLKITTVVERSAEVTFGASPRRRL
jgi:hypothetical protein